MVRKGKSPSRLASFVLSATLACTCLALPVFASTGAPETPTPGDSYTDDYSNFDFCVGIRTNGVGFTEDASLISYPFFADANDISVTYKEAGTELESILLSVQSDIRIYGFILDPDAEVLSHTEPMGTFQINNLTEDHLYSFESGERTVSAGSLSWDNMLVVIDNKDPRWATELAKCDPEDQAFYQSEGSMPIYCDTLYAVALANLNSEAHVGFALYDGKKGVVPNFIASATISDEDGNVISTAECQGGYALTFDLTGYSLDVPYTVDVLWFDADVDNAPRMGTLQWIPTSSSTPEFEYHLLSEFDWELGDAVVNMDNDLIPGEGDDELLWDDEGGIYDSTFRILVNSALEKYDTKVSGLDTILTLDGKATEGYVENNDRSGASVGDSVTWKKINARKSLSVNASVEAGSYTLSGSDQLDISYSGDFKIGSNETKDVELNVSPKYTLHITSKAGNVDCNVDGCPFSGVSSQDLALICDTDYTVYDNSSGKTYSVKPTASNPHIDLVLGADEYLIASDGPTYTDDVPKTADPIVIIMIAFWVLVAGAGACFIILYNKRKGDD